MRRPTNFNTLLTCKISCNDIGILLGALIRFGDEDETLREVVRQSGLQMMKAGMIEIGANEVIDIGDTDKPVDFTIPVWGVMVVTEMLNELRETKPEVWQEIPCEAWSPFVDKTTKLLSEMQDDMDAPQTFNASMN